MENPIEVEETTPQETPPAEATFPIRLNDSDIRTGFLLEIEAAKAQARLQTLQEAAAIFTAQTYQKYGITNQTHSLSDWLEGFVPVKKE